MEGQTDWLIYSGIMLMLVLMPFITPFISGERKRKKEEQQRRKQPLCPIGVCSFKYKDVQQTGDHEEADGIRTRSRK